MSEDVTYFGLTSFRNEKIKFGIKVDDRRRHFYLIGKTGMGKSNTMENMAIQDIKKGNGVAYIDPHGEGAEKLLDFVPSHRINDVIYFNPSDLDFPIAFNVMEKVDFKFRHLVASGLMGVFKKVWPDVWSARMEYILSNAILALLEYPDATLLGVNRMLADPEYRQKVIDKITDPIVKAFWVTEYSRYSQKYETEATAAIQNKVGQFISNPLIRNIIGQTRSTINMRDIMDKQKILIMNLSKGRIGEDNSRLLGALLITKLQLAAMSRVDIIEEKRKDFYLYVDEFQNFATESFANILSEARKYRLNLILGHQYINQMEEEVRDAVFGNVGTLVVFRVGAEDAEFLEKEFSPEFMATDIVNLGKYNIYLKLMIDGIAGHPFSAQTLPPEKLEEGQESCKEKIIKASQERYGVKRDIVDEKIMRWSFANQGDGTGEKPVQNQNKQPRSNQQNPDQTVLYDAICANCKKPTKIIFPPTDGRPVYCKSCLKKLKAGDSQNKPQTKPQDIPQNNPKVEDVSFNMHRTHNEQPQSQPYINKGKRPEVNLSELRKVLQESLEKERKIKEEQSNQEEQSSQEEKISKEEIILDNDNSDSVVKSTKIVAKPELSPEEKLQQAIKDSKTEDEVRGSSGVINPGETIKF